MSEEVMAQVGPQRRKKKNSSVSNLIGYWMDLLQRKNYLSAITKNQTLKPAVFL